VTGIDYFFMEKVLGVDTDSDMFAKADMPLTSKGVIRDYAATTIKLLERPFSAIGSLVALDGQGITVGPIVPIRSDIFRAPLGPFKTTRDRYLTKIDILLGHIQNGLLYREYAVQAYLAHLEARFLVETDEEMAYEESEFFIKHADDKDNNILWDGQGHLVAIVDWEL
jgi:hypothetical protein